MHAHRPAPTTTYRIQLSSSFTLQDVASQVPYLAELGISDVYLSPIYAATPGSTHGYDVVDHTTIDPERGGCDGWRQLCDTLRAHGMGVILDVVPNHMAAHPVFNHLWRRVLAEGPSSPASRHFDVDWRPLTGLIRDKVLLPVLEDRYGDALQQRRIALERADGTIRVRYNALHLPVAAGSVDPAMSDEAIAETNADPQKMHAVLEAQYYRLAYWRAANDEINYRRFFDVNELIAVCPEHDDVFAASHELILKLVGDEVVRGLRIDHVDGLLEPEAYLGHLRTAAEQAARRPMWIVVEKILDRWEKLDPAWPIEGTTGYDALNVLNRLFVSGRGVRVLRHFYQKLVDDDTGFRDIGYHCKAVVMARTLRSGLTLLAHALKRVADASWVTRDITLNALTAALVEFVACLPVYRTYLGNGGERRDDRDAVEQAFSWAIRRNPSMDPSALRFLRSLLLEPADADPNPSVMAARHAVVKRLEQYTSGVQAKGIEDTAYYRDNTLLALNEVGGDPGGPSGTLTEFHRFNELRAQHWPLAQTATSTHDTKLGEDSRIRLATLSVFANDWIGNVRTWLTANARFRQDLPKGPCPDLNDEYRVYQALVGVWPADDCRDGGGPARPEIVERMTGYMRKAVREARVHTSWMRVNDEYESALDNFIRAILTDGSSSTFRSSLRALLRLIMPMSVCHSISQLVLKCLMPGVPDIYQGDESWALALTDPDNRRPVDFAARAATLRALFPDGHAAADLRAASADDVLARDLKQYVTSQLLRFRNTHPFVTRAGYVPIRARGDRASGVVSFRRSRDREHVIVAVPRLVERSSFHTGWPTGADVWGNTELRMPPRVRAWSNVLSGQVVSLERVSRVPLAQLTERWPWVVLAGKE